MLRKLSGLKHYLPVSQEERVMHVHSRAGDRWRERFVGTGMVELDDPPVRIEVEIIFATIEIAA
jgi:hypothetical protein